MTKNRGPYRWGKAPALRRLEVGEQIEVPFISDSDYGSWRTTANALWRTFHAAFHCSRHGDTITIKRIY